MIYGTTIMGSSWRSFVNCIEGYDGPMLVLIRHIYKKPSKKINEIGIIGAYIPSQVGDYSNYQGDSDTCLFSILPKIHFMPAWKGKGGSNYVYFNIKTIPHSIHKAGLGFGGNNHKNWRLWIDEDMINKCTTDLADMTFPTGILNEGLDSEF